MGEGSFATAINCMDGRTQSTVIEYMKDRYGVEYVDMITEPGPIKALSEGSAGHPVDSIRERLAISVEKHGSKVTAVVGHHGCAGNPVEKETQFKQLALAAKAIESWGFGIEVVTLWVGPDWKARLAE